MIKIFIIANFIISILNFILIIMNLMCVSSEYDSNATFKKFKSNKKKTKSKDKVKKISTTTKESEQTNGLWTYTLENYNPKQNKEITSNNRNRFKKGGTKV